MVNEQRVEIKKEERKEIESKSVSRKRGKVIENKEKRNYKGGRRRTEEKRE